MITTIGRLQNLDKSFFDKIKDKLGFIIPNKLETFD